MRSVNRTIITVVLHRRRARPTQVFTLSFIILSTVRMLRCQATASLPSCSACYPCGEYWRRSSVIHNTADACWWDFSLLQNEKNWISYIRSIMCTYLCIISCFLCVFSSFLSYYYFHSSLFFIPSPAISSSLKGLECISLTLCDVRSVNVRNKGPLNLLHLEMNRVRSQERRWTHTVCLIKAVYLQQLI